MIKFDLGVKWVKFNQDHNLNNLGSTCIDNATYQVSRSSVYCFWKRRLFKVFTIYGHGGHVGHVRALTHLYIFSFLFSFKLSYELWFQIAQLFLRKTSFNFEISVIFDQGQRMTLTFDTHSTSLTNFAECFKQLET